MRVKDANTLVHNKCAVFTKCLNESYSFYGPVLQFKLESLGGKKNL